jgi:hypothetical protein
VRERRFLPLQVFCFWQAARGFSVTLDSSTKRFLSFCVLTLLCAQSRYLTSVLARASTLTGRTLSITTTFARAPHAGFAAARKTNRTEDESAFIADFSRENPALREEFASVPDGEKHN